MSVKISPFLSESEPRRLGSADALELAQLEAACFSKPWTERQFTEAFNRSDFYAIGICLGGQLAAYVSLSVIQPDAEILNIATKEAFRRQGLARTLLLHVAGNLSEWGVDRLLLEVRQNNKPANALYGKLGFKYAGRRKRYYQDPDEDALLMIYE